MTERGMAGRGMGSARGRSAAAVVVGLAVALGGCASPASAADGWRVTLHNPGPELGETPIVSEVDAAVAPGVYALEPEGEGRRALAQVFADAGKTYLAVVPKRLPAATDRRFAMTTETRPERLAPGVELRANGGEVDVLVGGKPLTTYHAGSGPKPYYFPLIGPTGASVTRAFPMKDVPGEDRDHPHQRSLWFTFGKLNGVDFWTELKGHGAIKETAREVIASGPVVGVLKTSDDWVGPDGAKVCSDARTLRVFDTTSGRVLDFDVTLKATSGPLAFGDTKEGMFGIRVASSMDVTAKAGGKITNAEGLTDDAAWGQASPWVDYSGPVEGKTVGVSVLNHPRSFRYPTTWHVRGYGLFAANPFGWKDFGMKTSGAYVAPEGGSVRFRYRVVLHEGDAASARPAGAFRGYAEPPTVEVRPG